MERWCKQKSNRPAQNPKLNIINLQKAFKINTKGLKKQLLFLLAHENILCDECNVYLVSKKKISFIHDKFFKDPSPTDCISISIDDPKKTFGYCHLGEIFICPEIAFEYSASHKGNFYEEVSLYLIHGFLHLIGYNDIEITDRRKMRRKERSCIKLLKSQGLL
jgi:probable rRNA maturation factor